MENNGQKNTSGDGEGDNNGVYFVCNVYKNMIGILMCTQTPGSGRKERRERKAEGTSQCIVSGIL